MTGAASGIGYAASLALAERGHSVIATDQTLASLDTLRSAVEQSGIAQRVRFEQLNIAQSEDWEKSSDWHVDVLINNAARGESGPLIEIPIERFRTLWETNVVGTLGLSQVVARQMMKQRSGRIIIVGSTAGLITLPMLGPYHMTKYALEAAADALRMELVQFGVEVSLIEPGKIATGFNQKMTATKYTWLDARSAYAEQIESMHRADQRFFAREYPVRVVVKAIVHAVEARRPRSRYVTPPPAIWAIRLARLLPDRVRDRALRN